MEVCAVLKYSSSVENRFSLPAYYQVNIEWLSEVNYINNQLDATITVY